MKMALTIAGSDPTGGAGLQLDLQVFRALGVHGLGVPTALTVQDTGRVHQVLPTFPSVVLDQLRVLLRDLTPAAVKIGMLASDDVARNVALALVGLDEAIPWVIDPVLASSDGTPLLERRAWPMLHSLFPRAALVTPNRPEAAALTGEDVSSDAGAEKAAASLLADGARAVLVKGGHREGAPRDLLALRDDQGERMRWLEGDRVAAGETHGTGCALSSAIAAGLALGQPLEVAVDAGRAFVTEALARAAASPPPGSGARVLVF
ncbi:MAG: bifunctional hydroxymethylpyrimidine kinase/phosphomethylpyrimidine kinase [Deltaproteobacteria bacterium]|nr:bifunctional hydroxymethylpyrimidine kinase/phosphomethylpyrimidine kinase [Deltaproteobacteria bacterium]MBW2444404.1 bifunctional hydroxymethylpyrimidine kinase/phosphomethylpyrimidine kinase [Deltaproteobacteria bacterium]